MIPTIPGQGEALMGGENSNRRTWGEGEGQSSRVLHTGPGQRFSIQKKTARKSTGESGGGKEPVRGKAFRNRVTVPIVTSRKTQGRGPKKRGHGLAVRRYQ